MDDFAQFQLKEYDNISQAHFKTNEVLATFYRYFILVTAIPVTTVGVALLNISKIGSDKDGLIMAHLIFEFSAITLGIFGMAVIAYIEGLRLDAIVYARVVNSIRAYFFLDERAQKFGRPVLPIERGKPKFSGMGASFIIYCACACMNSVYLTVGVIAVSLEHDQKLSEIELDCFQVWSMVFIFVAAMYVQVFIRSWLVSEKEKMQYDFG